MKILSHAGTAILIGSRAAVAIKDSTGRIYGGGKKDFTVPKQSSATKDGIQPWANWGADNRLPNLYANYFSGAGVLAGGVDIIARIAMGHGVIPVSVKVLDGDGKEEVTLVDDPEIKDWLKNNDVGLFAYSSIMDVLKTGHTFCQLLTNGKRDKINRIRRSDAAICRLGKYNDAGRIEHLYMSYEWGKVKTYDEKLSTVTRIPLLDRETPLIDLLTDDGAIKPLPREFAITSNYPLFGTRYYTSPAWWTVRQWADIAMKVPEMKAVMFNNQMTLKYFITIDDQYWSSRWKKWGTFTNEQREQYRTKALRELDDFLSGNDNAYKSLMTGARSVPDSDKTIPYIRVEALDDKIKDGKLLPDSAAANSEILFALALNPALLGVDMPGGSFSGGKGGSNIREAFLAQILVREIERGFVLRPLLVVAKVNGWLDKYPDLTFRFPSHYLTTLDTGKNAKPINL